MQELEEQERLQRLLLYVRAHAPVSRQQLQEALPECYEPYRGAPGDADALARHDNTVRKRLSRDRAKLEQLGFTLIMKNDCYQLDEQATYASETPEAGLSEEEASVIRQVASARLLDPDFLEKEALRHALAKRCVELDVPDALPLVDQKAAVSTEPHGLQKVLKAIRLRKRMRFEYTDAAGNVTTREVEPFGTYVHNRRCYAVCWDPQAGQAGEARNFRLDRMRRVQVSTRVSAGPDFPPRPFRLSEHYLLPFQLGECSMHATVRFAASCAWRAPALTRHRGTLTSQAAEAVTAQPDAHTGEQALLWHIEAADVERLARWCIENGPGITPLAPRALCDAYRRAPLKAEEACR